MQITKQDVRNLRKGMGLTAHDITKIFDCTEKTVYNKEKPADEPADLVWYYALRWVEYMMNTPVVLPANIQYGPGEYNITPT